MVNRTLAFIAAVAAAMAAAYTGSCLHRNELAEWRSKKATSDSLLALEQERTDSLTLVISQHDSLVTQQREVSDSAIAGHEDVIEEREQGNRIVDATLQQVRAELATVPLQPRVRSLVDHMGALYEQKVGNLNVVVARKDSIITEKNRQLSLLEVQVHNRDQLIAQLNTEKHALIEQVAFWQNEAKPGFLDGLGGDAIKVAAAFGAGVVAGRL